MTLYLQDTLGWSSRFGTARIIAVIMALMAVGYRDTDRAGPGHDDRGAQPRAALESGRR